MKIPNVRVHAEIPFSDGAEAVYIETVTKKTGVVSVGAWKKKRPYMIMIHANDWAKIKKSWLAACRSFRGKCNVTVDSIDKSIIKLDNIINGVLE